MNKEYIVINESENYVQEAFSIYKSLGKLICLNNKSKEINEHCNKITILVVRLGLNLNSNFLKTLPHLRYIVSPTTGLNHIDLDYCFNHGIEVLSLKEHKEFLQTVTATPEHTMGLIFALVRKILWAHLDVVNEKKWNRDKFCGRELSALNLGILGFGRIGQKVASYAKAFGMKVYAYSPDESSEKYQKLGVEKKIPEQLFISSDIITLHVDFTKERENLIGVKEFSLMKTGSYFINTSRGELVDEIALVNALKSGKLGGAAIDVLKNEQESSLLFSSPLFDYAHKNNNLIITPHIGGCTSDSMSKTETFMAKKLFESINGSPFRRDLL